MSEINLEDLGLKNNPFESIIADEQSAFVYTLYGRETELERFSQFIHEATKKNTQQRVMIMGDYGTGKTHHILHLLHDINSGKYGEGFAAVYLGNLGISFRRLYEIIISKTHEQLPQLSETINSLSSVEPGNSVERTYAQEKLRDNIIENLGILIANARKSGLKGIFLLIDEAEDIVQSDKADDIQYFVQCLLHLVNNLQGTPLHIIMGFSREAMSRVTEIGGVSTDGRKLGDAFLQRFPNKIQLGHLSANDAKLMVLDRLNSARLTRNEKFYPIKPEIIGVVSRLVSGHPREILAIMDQALRETIYSGEREITGSEIIQILSKHESFYSKSFILDWNSLMKITEDISAKNELLGKDFKRLSGKLLGEEGSVTENDFADSTFPELLTAPVGGIRILERRDNDCGETEYVINPDVKNAVFKEKRYDSDIALAVEREIIDLINYPEKYQTQLTHGLWKIVQAGWKAEFNSQKEMGPYLSIVGNVKTDASTTPVSVLFSSYKGSAFPEELYKGIIGSLESRQSGFAYVLYDGPRLTTDSHYTRLKNNLRDEGKERFLSNILTINAVELPMQKDQLMGQIKYLGNREIKPSDEINAADLFGILGTDKKLTELIDTLAMVYPEERIRTVINYFATNNLQSYSLKDLKAPLENNPYINTDFLERFYRQRFVRKIGAKWQIAQLDDNPPWKLIYAFIRNNGPSTMETIREDLKQKYVFQCPVGDENAMVNWYLQILTMLAIVDTKTENDAVFYQIIDHSKQLDLLLQSCGPALTEFKTVLDSAEPLQIPLSDYKTNYEAYKGKLDSYRDIFDAGNEEVIKCTSLLKEILASTEKLKKSIKTNQAEQSSRYDHVKKLVESFKSDLTKAETDRYISSVECKEWKETLHSELLKAETFLKNNEFSALAIALNSIDHSLTSLRDQIVDRKTSKQPCIDYSLKVAELISVCAALIKKMSDVNYCPDELKGRYQASCKKFDEDYAKYFNSGHYSDAKTCITAIHTELLAINSGLAQKCSDYKDYEARISSARKIVPDGDEILTAYIQAAEKSFAVWDFSQVATQLRLFDKAREGTKLKLPEDEFKELFKEHSTVKIEYALKTHSIEQVFQYLKVLYQKGEISSIDFRFK